VLKRLDEIEKTREPSKGAGGDGNTDNVKKSEGFWRGVV